MRLWWLAAGLIVMWLVGCGLVECELEGEKEIPLSQVPAAVVAAARGAVDGITLTEAEVETEDGQFVYTLEGAAQGKEYEIEVTPDGRVLEVEQEDEADDNDEPDDQEDED